MKFVIEEKAFLKLCYFIKNINSEIGGLLKINRDKSNIAIKDVILFKQEVDGVSVDLSSKDLGTFIHENKHDVKLLKGLHGWWHSHNNFRTFWSRTDNATFDHLLQYFGDFVVGVVTNKKHKFLFRYDTLNKDGKRISFKTREFTIFSKERGMESFCKKEIKEKVFEKPFLGDGLNGLFKAIRNIRPG